MGRLGKPPWARAVERESEAAPASRAVRRVMAVMSCLLFLYCALWLCPVAWLAWLAWLDWQALLDRKSTRLNSRHLVISYAGFCLEKKKISDIHISTHLYTQSVVISA